MCTRVSVAIDVVLRLFATLMKIRKMLSMDFEKKMDEILETKRRAYGEVE
jgi:hypothetical protein